jgi:hypothetical protein
MQSHGKESVYNGHPWDLKKVAVLKRCLIKLRFKLAFLVSNWPLLTGGRYSQVVVNSGLTVYIKEVSKNNKFLIIRKTFAIETFLN